VKPVLLDANQPQRFYRGGARIASFRGMPPLGEYVPEDWVGSTTELFGDHGGGLSVLPDGAVLRDRIAADPEAFLGPRHVELFGASPELLVKLLDAGQRLPVHVHPDREFSRRELGLDHGKTEAWIILGTRDDRPCTVHLGFRDNVDLLTLEQWVTAHDSASILAALNEVEVTPGDTIYVPAGTPHAIGEGVFLLELQEPSDLSVMLEWEGMPLDGDRDGHLGIGFPRALHAVDRTAWDAARLARVWHRKSSDDGHLLPPEADAFFRAQLVRGSGELKFPPELAILVVVEGAGELRSEDGSALALKRGQTALVPYAAGRTGFAGDLRLVRCLPPDPDSKRQPLAPA
jgi:mannose-6-phosphate isomerase